MDLTVRRKAVLALESGAVFEGRSCGADGETVGEVVFNTAHCGYQEILTDPSYFGQIVVMTVSHIGNYGVNAADAESRKPFANGFVVREASSITSNWRSEQDLQSYLQKAGIVAVEGIDTRALTLHLRERGAMNGVLSTKEFDTAKLIAKAKAAPSMVGRDLAREVSCDQAYEIDPAGGMEEFRVVILDCGVKRNSPFSLAQRGCRVSVVPATTSFETIMDYRPDGVHFSNGPGDPAVVSYGIDTIKKLVARNQKAGAGRKLPLFGICLGHQLLGWALGGRTAKLKFGHHGANHPVKDLRTGKVEITSQNHGFAVEMEKDKQNQLTLAGNPEVRITHLNLNDQTCEGMRHQHLPIFSVQYHPEASPGPHDAAYLFDEFIDEMRKAKETARA